MGPWDSAKLFFPRDTNKKQFDCAFKFLTEMNKVGEMTNSEVRHILDDPKDKVMLMSHVIPKLQKFGLIETDGTAHSKRYKIRFSKKFSQKLQHISLEWIAERLKKQPLGTPRSF